MGQESLEAVLPNSHCSIDRVLAGQCDRIDRRGTGPDGSCWGPGDRDDLGGDGEAETTMASLQTRGSSKAITGHAAFRSSLWATS